MKDKRPNIPKGSHVIDTGEYKLPTPMIYKLSEFVEKMRINRVPGAIIYGNQRYGKTKAIEYLSDELRITYGEDFPVLVIDFEYFTQASQGEFYDYLLDAVGHNIQEGSRKGKIDKRNRLVTFIEHKAIMNGNNRVVVFLDEAQNLKINHFKWLNGIYNKLVNQKKIKPLFLLFGQPELLTNRNNFIKEKQNQIIGRFMIHMVKFEGLKDAADIETCLEGYDQAEYPPGSGWTITRYFFPDVDPEQWCLAHETQNAWQAFTKARSHSLIRKDNGISMLYFTLTIEYLLRNFQSEDSKFRGFSQHQWDEAISFSGYQLAAQTMSVE